MGSRPERFFLTSLGSCPRMRTSHTIRRELLWRRNKKTTRDPGAPIGRPSSKDRSKEQTRDATTGRPGTVADGQAEMRVASSIAIGPGQGSGDSARWALFRASLANADPGQPGSCRIAESPLESA